MAARRLGFPNLFAALNDGAPQSMSDGIADGTAWPLRPFTQHLLPMIIAVRDEDQFEVMSLLRAESPHLHAERLRGQAVGPVLTALQQAVDTLRDMLADGSLSTIRQLLQHACDTGLLSLDKRFAAHFVAEPADDGSPGYANVAAFLACGVGELWAHRRYMLEESPFATHHGVKGAQFERVMVVLDDEEATFNQYSYGKYLGFTPLSDNDEARIAAGEESVLDRTRRLFYVCCSRALKDLAVVLFVHDVAAARAAVTAAQLFPEVAIRELQELV
jgi:DNA helicase-2/ATP-dependent DNA helicase PcrA